MLLMALGFGLVFILPVLYSSQKRVLAANEFATQVTLPVTIGLLCLAYSMYNGLREDDEKTMGIVVVTTACLSAAFSIVTGSFSVIRMRWAAD